jgi:HK97 family phage major capsid protein
MVSLGNRPLSVIGPVRANTSEQIAYIKQIGAAFDEFKATYNQRWDNTQRIFDDINARMAGGLAVNSAIVPPDPEYSKTFASYFRSGEAEGELKSANATGQRHAVQAAMSVGTNSAGGYLAPVEWDRQVSKTLIPKSPMRRLAKVVPTSVRAFSTLYSDSGTASGWVGETASRPNTATPNLSSLEFPSGEIYANPAITQQLLDDADFAIDTWLADEVSDIRHRRGLCWRAPRRQSDRRSIGGRGPNGDS